MPGVPAMIAIQPVPHMQQLLAHDDFQSVWLALLDSPKIDEDQMLVPARVVHVGTTDGTANPAANPLVVRCPFRRHPEIGSRELEFPDICFQMRENAFVIEIEQHE